VIRDFNNALCEVDPSVSEGKKNDGAYVENDASIEQTNAQGRKLTTFHFTDDDDDYKDIETTAHVDTNERYVRDEVVRDEVNPSFKRKKRELDNKKHMIGDINFRRMYSGGIQQGCKKEVNKILGSNDSSDSLRESKFPDSSLCGNTSYYDMGSEKKFAVFTESFPEGSILDPREFSTTPKSCEHITWGVKTFDPEAYDLDKILVKTKEPFHINYFDEEIEREEEL
ncbi:Hypothetical predicted protein, partial [Olea europaea subsp. europaea]